jgi:hypothetical protein
MRTLTLKELVLEELNRQLAEEGRDVCVVTERPKPQLAASEGEVVEFNPRKEQGAIQRLTDAMLPYGQEPIAEKRMNTIVKRTEI